MEAKAGRPGFERGPFRRGFLNSVLAEIALARGDQGRDARGGLSLADGDQRDIGRIARYRPRRRGNVPQYAFEILREFARVRHVPIASKRRR